MENSSGLVFRNEDGRTGVETFISEQNHKKALEHGLDIPEEKPSFPIPLTAVGIGEKTVWVYLPQGRIPFTAKIDVDLPAEVRGIHMSRMEEVVTELIDLKFRSACDYAHELGRRMLLKQKGGRGTVTLAGKIPITRDTSISGKVSIDSVDITVEAQCQKVNGQVDITVFSGVSVCHITACPCTQAYNNVLYPENICPQPTHSQRSLTTLTVEIQNDRPGIDEMIHCLESSLHVTQDLLKRPDEAEIVMKAHLHPQFAEDAVRETARAARNLFSGVLPGDAVVAIESISLESIHIHDVHCRLETTMAELKNIKDNVLP